MGGRPSTGVFVDRVEVGDAEVGFEPRQPGIRVALINNVELSRWPSRAICGWQDQVVGFDAFLGLEKRRVSYNEGRGSDSLMPRCRRSWGRH